MITRGLKMTRKLISIVALTLAVGGCAASRTITQDDDAVCKGMGASPGTDCLRPVSLGATGAA